jgi:23S rRNA U2552 (ribose-2'-O)-methylase RlmE/FtsJ
MKLLEHNLNKNLPNFEGSRIILTHKYISAKDDILFKKMKILSDKYWDLDLFDRENNTEFFEDKKELMKIGQEIFDNFKLKTKYIKSFIDVCAAPGVYSTLILNNLSNVNGIGISLPTEEGGVSLDIDDKRYKIIYKNILTLKSKDYFVKKIDLGIASCVSYQFDAKKAYFLNLELIITSIKLILKNLKSNGHIIINLTIKNINLAFNIINLLNTMFNKFKLWKSKNIWERKKTFYYFGYNFKNNFDITIFENLEKKIKNNYDHINNYFLGSTENYDNIYKQMKNIYKIRINALKKLNKN